MANKENENIDMEQTASPCATYLFKKPTVLAFMGIPGSGKSTIARSLASLFNDCACYLENEEDAYPAEIKAKFKHPTLGSNTLDIHRYFRDMRAEYHRLADENKMNAQRPLSTIMDSFFSKLMLNILRRPHTECFIDPASRDYERIIAISERDELELADADIVVFLHTSADIHAKFVSKRRRTCEADERIFMAQPAFLAATLDYAKRCGKRFYLVEQEMSVRKVVASIVDMLKRDDLIQ